MSKLVNTSPLTKISQLLNNHSVFINIKRKMSRGHSSFLKEDLTAWSWHNWTHSIIASIILPINWIYSYNSFITIFHLIIYWFLVVAVLCSSPSCLTFLAPFTSNILWSFHSEGKVPFFFYSPGQNASRTAGLDSWTRGSCCKMVGICPHLHPSTGAVSSALFGFCKMRLGSPRQGRECTQFFRTFYCLSLRQSSGSWKKKSATQI